MYLRIAEEEDQRRVELLKAETEQILIFVSPRITYYHSSTMSLRDSIRRL